MSADFEPTRVRPNSVCVVDDRGGQPQDAVGDGVEHGRISTGEHICRRSARGWGGGGHESSSGIGVREGIATCL